MADNTANLLSISNDETLYFGYGSNLWLQQMSLRCPNSAYVGVGRLNNYQWIINSRGYANVVACNKASSHSSTSGSPSAGLSKLGRAIQGVIDVEVTQTWRENDTEDEESVDVVYGLVYSLTAEDEAALDENEGVPEAYTKEELLVDFWCTGTGSRAKQGINVKSRPETRRMLVYIDRKRTFDDEPRDEYIYRMNRGIKDALAMGIPNAYVQEVMRKFIPADDGQFGSQVEELAKRQAIAFNDER